MKDPRLKGRPPRNSGIWPIGSIPDTVLFGISRQIVHRLATGHADITGDDFGTIFANAVDGEHIQSSLGVSDVVRNGCAWSVKTVKEKRPLNRIGKKIRLISGRNSPDFSVGISDPRADPEKTGQAVLSIWNARVDLAREQSDDVRIAVLCRNMAAQKFLLFEQPCGHFPIDEYYWRTNKGNNLEGCLKVSEEHCFTWQPHGSQFTIVQKIPGSARLFEIPKSVPIIETQKVLDDVGYKDSWVNIVQ